jgi:hypothetical protein
MPGHLHDLTCAQTLDVTGALYRAAAELNLPTLAASPRTTAPTTPPFDPCDASENAASPS